jgi:MinD-like ATPase involved in chromosome partitioning or flagellar assembly
MYKEGKGLYMAIKKGKSLCIFSAKGGVGKTTNLINIAGIFEQLEKKVLLVDIDLYSGGIATYLNKPYEKSIYNLCDDILNNRVEDFKNYITPYDKYIDILPAPKDPRTSNRIDPRTFESLVDMSTSEYDVVLFDTNHALDDINLTILSLVDEILFITTIDPMDLSNLKSLLSIFNRLEYTNYKVMLNYSKDPNRDYLTTYDVKHILKHEINYVLTSNLYLKEMDRHVMNGSIITLDKKFASIMPEDYQTFLHITTDLLGGNNHE